MLRKLKDITSGQHHGPLGDVVNRYHVADARNLPLLVPSQAQVDVTITSPPYWDLKDYGSKNQVGYGQSYDAYLDDIERIFKGVYDRTKDTGSLWIVSDTLKQDGELRLLPFDISARLKKSGWILQDIIIWQKDRTLPWSHQGKLRNIFEYVTFYSKSPNFKYHISRVRDIADLKDYWVRYPERYSPEGKTPTRTWHIPIPRQGSWGRSQNFIRHACPLPLSLVERILSISTDAGDLVLDPFAGSGVVLAVAEAMGRQFIGLDLNEKYQGLFDDTVRPSMRAAYDAKATDEAATDAKAIFGSLIGSLRSLKFPKEFIRLYRTRVGAIDPTAVLVKPTGKDEVQIELVFAANKHIPKNFASHTKKLCSQAPLSKYGIAFSVNATTTSRASKRRPRRPAERLCVYTNGRFFWPSDSIAAAELGGWLRQEAASPRKRGYPPIVSSLHVRVNPDKPAADEKGITWPRRRAEGASQKRS